MRTLPILLGLSLLSVTAYYAVAAKGEFADPKAVYERVKAGKALLVDVREADEVNLGMAEPALWMPTSEIYEGSKKWEAFLEKLPTGEEKKSKTVVLYCRSGRRAAQAAAKLSDLGYKTENMGPFSAWEDAKLPIRKQ